jgi:hypothetical protein
VLGRYDVDYPSPNAPPPPVDKLSGCRGIFNALIFTALLAVLIGGAVYWWLW